MCFQLLILRNFVRIFWFSFVFQIFLNIFCWLLFLNFVSFPCFRYNFFLNFKYNTYLKTLPFIDTHLFIEIWCILWKWFDIWGSSKLRLNKSYELSYDWLPEGTLLYPLEDLTSKPSHRYCSWVIPRLFWSSPASATTSFILSRQLKPYIWIEFSS